MNLREKAKHWATLFEASVARQPILFFTLLALALIWVGQIGAAHEVLFTGFLRDTDDAMRLVEVRDFLAGQNWFDLTQHRLDPPYGVLMHWSRLIDAPIAALILFFKLFTSQDMAERITRLVWPALLQAGFMATVLTMTKQLAGRDALFPAAVFAGFGWILSAQFEPGRIDHHSAQLVLSGLMAVCILASDKKPAVAFFAGLAAALMAAIGFESLAVTAIAGLYIFAAWLYGQPYGGARMRNFGIGLGLGPLVLYLATTPPHLYFTVFCDAQSLLSTLTLTGAGLVAIALSGSDRFFNTIMKRLAAAAFCAAILAMMIYPHATQCLAGPFAALPEDLQRNWLDKVTEAMGIGEHLKENFWGYFPFAAPLFFCLACAVAAFYLQAAARWRWTLVTVLAAVHTALTFQHLRLISFACMFAAPACAWCIVQLRIRSQLAMALLYIACIPAFWALVSNHFGEPPPSVKTNCNTPANFAALADLRAGTVLAPTDMGPHLLAYTQHSVFGAPYHRNVEGMRLINNTLYVDFKDALPNLHAKKPDYIALCDGLGELNGVQKDAPDSFAARLMKDEHFAGVKKLDLNTPLLVWQVDYSALPAR